MINKEYVYILILNYNNFVKTINCINSILDSNYQYYKILLIDNHSSDNSYSRFSKWININNIKSIELIKNNKNGGYAYGNNVGLKIVNKYPDCNLIWILNNDTLVHKESLSELIKSYDSSTSSIYGSKIINYNNNNVESLGGIVNKDNLKTENIIEHTGNIDYIPGVSLFFSKDIISQIGYIPEDYFMYYEDVDWCTKALSKNIKLKIVNRSEVYHDRTIKNNFTIRSIYNRLIYCMKYYPHKIIKVIIRIIIPEYSIINK